MLHLLRIILIAFTFVYLLSSCENSGQLVSQDNHKYTNALINESSPYLLQHAHNPVDWHPWNEETLAKAKKENKLLIISIGYAACHWCHVMEHESFEDEEVAKIMNEHFLPIKVDREERPDVDDIYMTACNLVSGRGGWPLNAFAMPDGRPVWAGTYFPKENWVEILNQFINLKDNNPEKLEDTADRLTSGVKSVGIIEVSSVPETFSSDQLAESVQRMLTQIDRLRGGRKGAPKFPMPNNYEFLLKYGFLKENEDAIELTKLTLDKMARGGIYDHVGGGFARYSVDAEWKVPHFEKMLYDNAQLIGLYSQAYRMSKNDLYKNVVIQSLDFIKREMTSPEGGFYSSLDADSEGVEGKFYVWTESELEEVLEDPILIQTAKEYYSTEEEGNWEHSNILHINDSPSDIAERLEISQKELNDRVQTINKVLLVARAARVRPGLDDKILTGWNALMISGYVEAYKAFGNEEYLETAKRNAAFLLAKQMDNDHRLNRNYKAGKSSINAFLDDYVALTKALLDLYEVTFDIKWIDEADALIKYTIDHFEDPANGMFFRTSDLDPPLISRTTEVTDNVIPAANSMMARNLYRIGQLTYNKEYLERRSQLLANIYPTLLESSQPGYYSNWLQLWLDMTNPPYEVVITGDDLYEKSQNLQSNYLGNAMILGTDEADTKLPLVEHKFIPGKTLIYVCDNKICQLPVEHVDEALKLMH